MKSFQLKICVNGNEKPLSFPMTFVPVEVSITIYKDFAEPHLDCGNANS